MNNNTRLPLAVLLFIFCTSLSAQQLFVRGRIIDAKDSSAVPGAQVILYSLPDTTVIKADQSDSTGKFAFNDVQPGKYRLKIMFVGYKSLVKEFEVNDKPVFLRKLALEGDAHILKQVDVEAVQVRQEQKGDTTIYNADAFKVNKDASTEDLVKKMPGVTVENGVVKHQGEDVKKVLIDGKEFFGDDANIALKNLPAEMVDKIQVFDRSSDQSFFSGFDDGNSQKTLNVMTKNNKNNGQFGKLYAGYGTDERYQSGANYNLFKGARRISFVGMSNNINMQNFGSQDLLGLTGSQGGQRGGMGGYKGGHKGGGGSYGGYGRGGDQGFTVGQQGGISTTHSAGLNYSDVWGKRTLVTASYFFNYMDNDAISSLQRNYFSSSSVGQIYEEGKTALSTNMNHRFNMRLEFFIDSMNSLLFNPRLSYQGNNATNNTIGETALLDTALSATNSNYFTDHSGFNSNNSLLYRRRFKKAGRTFSAQISADINSKRGNTTNLSLNRYYYDTYVDSVQLDQASNNSEGGNNYGVSLSYTEPLSQKLMLQLTYNPSLNLNGADKKTYNLDTLTDEHNRLDTALTNEYTNTIHTQKGGANIRFRNQKVMISAGANYQYVNLFGDQQFPRATTIDKTFLNVLPLAVMQFRFTKTSNLRLNYRTFTSVPSVSQLQSVIDNSNPLLLSTGNPELKQNFNQFMSARFNITNPQTSRSFFMFAMANVVNNYVANSTVIARNDTVLNGGVTLYKGSQLSMPVNLEGNWSARTFATYSTPVKKLKSTFNFNLGASYSNLPGLINYAKNIAKTTSMNGGIVIASNISEKLDFTVMWHGEYNVVTNTLQTSNNNNYFFHNSSAKLNWNIWKNLHLATDFTYTHYDGLRSNFIQKYTLWNNSLAWKFLKNNAGEIKLSVYDVLKQNNSVSRNVTETYVEDNQTKVLQRYYMMTFTWTFRKFASQNTEQNGSNNNNQNQQPEKK